MCLHGFSQSGQVQVAVSSRAERENSVSLQDANRSSISRGISPASSFASGSACSAIAFSTRRH
jgi:hypothetical protein